MAALTASPARRAPQALPEVRRAGVGGLLLLPAVLVVYFAFNSGGFYPGAPAYVAVALCVVLAVRVVVAPDPWAGRSRAWMLAACALGLYTALTLLSGAWSHAPGVARIEFDLPLVYLLALVLCGSVGHTPGRVRWTVRGLALAAAVTCVCGLVTRVLPHWWPTSPELDTNRLSFPVTYWNVLGMVAGVGIVLCLHLTSDLREPRASRIVTAAALPILAATLFFTFSRGAIAVLVIAVAVYVVVGRPRGLPASALACGPATALAIKLCYGANLLASQNLGTPAAVAQGSHLAVALLDCALGAAILRLGLVLALDGRLAAISVPERTRRQALRVLGLVLAAALAGVCIAFSSTIADQYHRFLRPAGPGSATDLRTRLTDPANNGRLDLWKVAWRGFRSAPAVGHGAGTFADTWARTALDGQVVRDAHSLYLETLDELGIVGLSLLLIVIVTVFVRVGIRVRGPDRSLYAALGAVMLAWAIHAGIDWDWEMPVITVVFFALGGLVLAGPPDGRDADRAGSAPGQGRRRDARQWALRGGAAVAALAVGLLPGAVWISQVSLDNAVYGFAHGDCPAARAAAGSSIATLGDRSEPYEIMALCDLRLRMPDAAVAAMSRAVSLDPGDWRPAYGLALVRAAVGADPRRDATAAVALNPRDPLVRSAWRLFETSKPARWRSQGRALAERLTSL